MPGRIRPKSMSTEEAADWIANPGDPPADDTVEPSAELPFDDTTMEQLREALSYANQTVEQPETQQGEAGRDDDYEAGELPALQLGQAPDLRGNDDVDADVDVLTGWYTLSYTPEQRHMVTLRLIDDLYAARNILDGLAEVLGGAR